MLGSFNQLAKVREETLQFWLAAMQALPEARLVIKDRSVNDPVVRERITAVLSRGGVAPDRIRFLPPIGSWEEHMATYNQLDVALDATPGAVPPPASMPWRWGCRWWPSAAIAPRPG